MGITTVSVSEQVKAKLDGIKIRDGHTSIDSVIRSLLERDGKVEVKCNSSKCLNNAEGLCHAKSITNAYVYNCFVPKSGLSEASFDRTPKMETPEKEVKQDGKNQ